MNETTLSFLSTTHAYGAKRQLEKSGIKARISRAPKGLSDMGCAYILTFDSRHKDFVINGLEAAKYNFRVVN